MLELRCRDIRAEPRHFDLLLLSGGILREIIWIKRLFELRHEYFSSAHRPTRMHALYFRELLFHYWPFRRFGCLLDRDLLRRIGNFVLHLRRWYLCFNRCPICMHVL